MGFLGGLWPENRPFEESSAHDVETRSRVPTLRQQRGRTHLRLP
jgi:hypothetical protein